MENPADWVGCVRNHSVYRETEHLFPEQERAVELGNLNQRKTGVAEDHVGLRLDPYETRQHFCHVFHCSDPNEATLITVRMIEMRPSAQSKL